MSAEEDAKLNAMGIGEIVEKNKLDIEFRKILEQAQRRGLSFFPSSFRDTRHIQNAITFLQNLKDAMEKEL